MPTGVALTQRIIGMAMDVHRHFGPGPLDSACEACLCLDLEQAGILRERQVQRPVIHKHLRIDITLCAEVVVAQEVMSN